MNRLLIVFLIAAFSVSAANAQTPADRPHLVRQGENLIRNPTLNTTKNWKLLRDAIFDESTSRRNDGSGSFKLVTPYPDKKFATAKADLIAVEPGERYMYGFHIKTLNGPTYVGAQISLHDENRRFLRNFVSAVGGTTGDSAWQEHALPFVVPEGVAFIGCQVYKTYNTKPGGVVWADDFYLGKGFGLADPPSPKKAFHGERVRVDSLGNFEIKRNGKWDPFFPLCMYKDNRRPDWKIYSKQGWNTVLAVGSALQIQKAKEAVSKFNPRGMMVGVGLASYAFPGKNYNNLKQLRQRLHKIFLNRHLSEHVLLYYLDNEKNHDQWQVPAKVINTIRHQETNSFGHLQCPVYALQGTFNIAAVHAANGLVDVSGTYFGGSAESRGKAGIQDRGGLLVLDRKNGQKSPASFAQFNGVDGAGEMRLRLYSSIIFGAKAMGYWRDCYKSCNEKYMKSVGPVEAKPWWPDFPNLRREIDRLMPLIRQPHWTEWTATARNEKVLVGTRDMQGKGFLILVNQSTESQEVTVDLKGLSYQPSEVWDVLEPKKIAVVDQGKLTLTLPGNGIGSGTQVVLLQ